MLGRRGSSSSVFQFTNNLDYPGYVYRVFIEMEKIPLYDIINELLAMLRY